MLLYYVISIPNQFQAIFCFNSRFGLIDDLADGYHEVNPDFEFKVDSFDIRF